MVSDSDAPGMNLSSRSKAAAAAMVGGERRMGVGGGGVSRQRFIKDVGVNRTKKKVGPRQATTAAKSSKNNKVVRSSDSAKNLRHFIPHNLNEPQIITKNKTNAISFPNT